MDLPVDRDEIILLILVRHSLMVLRVTILGLSQVTELY